MTKEPSGHSHDHQITTPEERLQHDIEELEGGAGWRGVLKWVGIIVVVAAVVVVLYMSGSKRTEPRAPRMNSKGGVLIEMQEPRPGKLAAAPTSFKWESVVGRNDYMFRILVKGEPRVVVERVVRENSATLTAEEAGRLKPGTSYIWEVEARGKDGKTLGSGRGMFDL